MNESKPMSFLAIQNEFLKDLKYAISNAYNKAGYVNIDYPELIVILEEALQKAHELNALDKGRIAFEKEFVKDDK